MWLKASNSSGCQVAEVPHCYCGKRRGSGDGAGNSIPAPAPLHQSGLISTNTQISLKFAREPVQWPRSANDPLAKPLDSRPRVHLVTPNKLITTGKKNIPNYTSKYPRDKHQFAQRNAAIGQQSRERNKPPASCTVLFSSYLERIHHMHAYREHT